MTSHNEDIRSPEQLYDVTAHAWIRSIPSSLSDFTARPAVLEMCAPLDHQRCLDLGCGEGYCSRLLKRSGAGEVLGIDISQAMIDAARAEEDREPLGVQYQRGEATDLHGLASQQFDLVLAVFLFNYLDTTAMATCMREIERVLRPGGRFVFAVPHPLFPYVRAPSPPFFFDTNSRGYYSGRNQCFAGAIYKRDGTELKVQAIHKTFQDYFDALRSAGFDCLPVLRELTVEPQTLAIDPEFFSPLVDIPLHVAFSLKRA
jgi:SAM-dependent methyltransferase